MTASPAAGGRRIGRGERPGRSRGGGWARGGGWTTGLRAAQVMPRVVVLGDEDE